MTIENVEARAFLEEITGGPLTFGRFMRAIREGEELSLVAFAKQRGVSRPHLCDIEKGRRSVSPARAAAWAKQLGYSDRQFVELALQDQLSQAGIDMHVHVQA